jgi:hypothetical protein
MNWSKGEPDWESWPSESGRGVWASMSGGDMTKWSKCVPICTVFNPASDTYTSTYFYVLAYTFLRQTYTATYLFVLAKTTIYSDVLAYTAIYLVLVYTNTYFWGFSIKSMYWYLLNENILECRKLHIGNVQFSALIEFALKSTTDTMLAILVLALLDNLLSQ